MKLFSAASAAIVFAASLGLFFGTANTLTHLPLVILFYPAALYAAALRSASPFRLGWCAGLPGAAAALYWIAVAAHEYGCFPWGLAVPCSILLGMYVSLWGGVFAWLTARMRGFASWRRALAASLLWMLLEWTRGWFCTGFPWLTVSSGLAAWPVLLQPLSVLGAYGYSGVLALAAFLLCEAAGVSRISSGADSGEHQAEVPRRRSFCLLAAVAVLASCAVFGVWRMSALPASLAAEGVPVTVTMVQGNVPQDAKWTPEYQRFTLEKYLRLSMEGIRTQTEALNAIRSAGGQLRPDAAAVAASSGLRIGSAKDAVLSPALPEMLLWPETALPFAFPQNENSAEVRAFVDGLGLPLVFGAPGVEYALRERKLFNRSFLLTPQGKGGHYDKEHLVPFGEYLPPVLDWKLFQPLLQGLGGFTAGKAQPLFVLEPQGRPAVPMGMLICYEAVFPELARARAASGAQILLNISNDAWYDFTSAPMQHLHLSLMRAVEQGRWMARATNSGVTAFLDPLGGVHALGTDSDGWALFKDGALTGTVLALRSHTPYFYLHPWLPALAAILLAVLCAPLFRRVRPKTR
ncbi:apolipoprotein N-acyltransferase [Mailhella sp.]|uniref:apolipoprotein N-acyltransferase n=1 Tax=Mailhella sp. TaxID=1981029 RepID=UPI00406306AC